MTSASGTNRNFASRSMKRLINQGQAMRSTRAFSRVTQFIVSSSIWPSRYWSARAPPVTRVPRSRLDQPWRVRMRLLLSRRLHADPTNDEVVERRNGIRLRPQPHAPRLEPRVVVIEVEPAVEPRLHVIADRHDAQRVPLAERRRLDGGARELVAAAVVVVQAKVFLERVGAHDVVRAVPEAEHDAARGVLAARDRFEAHRHLPVGVRAEEIG